MTEVLCDRCRREFEVPDDLADFQGELLCPDCKRDADENLEDELL